MPTVLEIIANQAKNSGSSSNQLTPIAISPAPTPIAVPSLLASDYGPYVTGAAPAAQVPSAPSINVYAAPAGTGISPVDIREVAAPAPAPAPVSTPANLIASQTVADKATLGSLQKAGQAEISIFKTEAKQAGLTKAEITAAVKLMEQQNKAELAKAKSTGFVPTLGGKVVSGLLSQDFSGNAANVVNSTAQEISSAVQFMNQNGLTQSTNKKGVGSGFSGVYVLNNLSQMDNPTVADAKLLGAKHPAEALKIISALEAGAPTTTEGLKQVKNNGGLSTNLGTVYSDKTNVGDGRSLTTYYIQKPDGTIVEASNTYQSINTKEGIGTLGAIALGIAGSLLVPGLGSVFAGGSFLPAAGAAYGAGSTIGSLAAAGGLVGAGTAAITGNDILTGGLLGAAGGAAGGYIGQNGGLGNVLAKNGITMSQSTIDTLNKFVSGIGQPTVSQANAAATLMTNSGIATTVDDIAAATGGVVDDVTGATFRPGQTITGLLDDTGAGLRLTPNMQEGFIRTPVGGGTLQSIPTPAPGTFGGIGFNPNVGGIGLKINPEDFIPTPVGGGTVPDVSGVNTYLDRYISPPIGGNTVTTGSGEYPSAINNGGTFIGDAKKIIDDAVTAAIKNPITTIGVASTIPSIINPPTVPPVKPTVLSPDIRFNPAIFGTAGPGFDFNAFMNLYRRGGLGAGQYLGYDLINRLGDIPLQTLLGTPIMGGQVGQTNASTASLV